MKNSKAKAEQEKNPELARLEQQVASLAEGLEKLSRQLAEQSKVVAELVAGASGHPSAHTGMQAASASPPVADIAEENEPSPELLVVMVAAITAYLGKPVRIRSAKMLQSPYEIINPWAQQGRVTVQASHFLRRA